MSKRIGLFTPVAQTGKKKKGARTTSTVYVEVENAAGLVEKLAALGAKRVGLLRRDRAGTTHLEGDMFAPDGVNDKHLEWLATKPAEFETRGLFYE